MNNRETPVLYIVIPCYNEEAVLPITAPMFLQKITDLAAAGKISPESRVLFVNDGSKDKTWQIITELANSDPHYIGISQSRNRGHQNAVLAGLMEAKDRCDITISIDCDGQDDINAMDAMVDAQPDTVAPSSASMMAQTTPRKDTPATSTPKPVIKRIGLTERLVMPSNARPSILESG